MIYFVIDVNVRVSFFLPKRNDNKRRRLIDIDEHFFVQKKKYKLLFLDPGTDAKKIKTHFPLVM